LLVLLFDPEDDSVMCPRNVGLSEIHGVVTQKTVILIVTIAKLKFQGLKDFHL
jgi:hypothetical protein